MSRSCPCGSNATFSDCCRPCLDGERHAPTAQALMRSRYAAFCEGAVEYLLATHLGAENRAGEREDLRRSIAGTHWIALTILDTRKGGVADTTGIVDFVAAFRPRGLAPGPVEIGQMHERSRFVRQGGRWLYTDGDALAPYVPGRNERCWCGSGRKYKQCHG